MAFGLNLRADLAKLSDLELAARFDQISQALGDAARRRPWPWRPISFRGPIRHPRAYRFLSLLQGSSGSPWFDWLIAAIFSSKRYETCLNKTSPSATHLHVCEMQDIVDEIERRLQYRKARTA